MITPTAPVVSWTARDPEKKREHDFNNWIQELVMAVSAAEDQLARHCIDQLQAMYKAANRK